MENSKSCLNDQELSSVSGGFDSPEIPQYTLYRVQPGDCATGIAWKFGMKYEKFLEMNDFENPDFIRAGDLVKIPYRGCRYYVED